MRGLDGDVDPIRHRLLARALALSYFSVAWGLIAGTWAIIVGLLAGSLGVLGLGLNVLADMVGSMGLVWRFGVERHDPTRGLRAEARASLVVATAESGGNHAYGRRHQRSSLAFGARALPPGNDLSRGLCCRARPPGMGEVSNGKASAQSRLDGRCDVERRGSRSRNACTSRTLGRPTLRVVVGGSGYCALRCGCCFR
jgi:hypothetical protein